MLPNLLLSTTFALEFLDMLVQVVKMLSLLAKLLLQLSQAGGFCKYVYSLGDQATGVPLHLLVSDVLGLVGLLSSVPRITNRARQTNLSNPARHGCTNLEAAPPDLVEPVSPSAALITATEKDRWTDGVALASLTI